MLLMAYMDIADSCDVTEVYIMYIHLPLVLEVALEQVAHAYLCHIIHNILIV